MLYTHGSRGQEVRCLTAGEETPLLDYFAVYSARFTGLLDATLAVHERAVILDIHSYPEHKLPYELHGDGYRPTLCVGSEQFHASGALLAAVAECFTELDARANEPSAGAYVPLKHYGSDARVSSVMLGIRRGAYMTEATVTRKPKGYAAVQQPLQLLVDRVAQN